MLNEKVQRGGSREASEGVGGMVQIVGSYVWLPEGLWRQARLILIMTSQKRELQKARGEALTWLGQGESKR